MIISREYKIYYALNGRHRIGMHTVIRAKNEQSALKKFKQKFDGYEPVYIDRVDIKLGYECRPHYTNCRKPIMQVYGKEEEIA